MKQQWPYFVFVFALPVLAVLWWWGLFSQANVRVETSSEYRFAYLDAEGAYSKLASKQAEAGFYIKQQGLVAGKAITVISDDPRTTTTDHRHAKTGFIIDVNANPVAPLLVTRIPARQVLVAEIKAHPLVAYGKVYGALLQYTKLHQIPFHLPTVEIYHASVLRVEMPLDVSGDVVKP